MSPKRLITALLAASTLAAPASAAAAPTPDQRWPVAGPAIQGALQIAQRTWGVPVCPAAGGFTVTWDANQPSTYNAFASFDQAGMDRPLEMVNCQVHLNPKVAWNWSKLCTIVVHEVGHLAGRDHAADKDDVMYPYYVGPVAACYVDEPGVAVKVKRTARTVVRARSAGRTTKVA